MSLITNRHPSYTEFSEHWLFMTHSYKGGPMIKSQDITYLPPTGGQVADGARAENIPGNPNSEGQAAYDAYIKRAYYHNFVKRAVKAALGVMHSKSAKIELPAKLEYLREKATNKGESLIALLRKINERQLVEGRLGLLLDIPKENGGKNDLYFSLYHAGQILNWDDGVREDLTKGNLNLVVLDETGFARSNHFQWELKTRYRVLVLGDLEENEGERQESMYRAGIFEGSTQRAESLNFEEDKLKTIGIQGKNPKEIPFTFINSSDNVPEAEEPPLLDLAELAITVYRGEADYRQNLFMQGQDTLVIIGGTTKKVDGAQRVGAGAKINVPLKGDAKYIGVDSKGLPEQRTALENDKQEAAQQGGQLLDTSSRTKESEGSLGIRVSGQTATLTEITLAGAGGLENALKQAARWVGENPDEVKVTPNLDFASEEIDGEGLKMFMEAYVMGAPLSLKSIHKFLRKKELTDRTFKEEMAERENDPELIPQVTEPIPSSTNPSEE